MHRLGYVVAALGLALIGVAWIGASPETDPAHQFGWLSVSIAGIALVLAGMGGASFVRAARAVRRAGVLERRLAELHESVRSRLATVGGSESARASTLVSVKDGVTYHRPSCLVVEGKDEVCSVDGNAVERRGLRPCRLCEPPAPSATAPRQLVE